METKLYTCSEVAEMYNVKVGTVWDWIRKGKIGCVKLGRIYRIRSKDLKAFEKVFNNV